MKNNIYIYTYHEKKNTISKKKISKGKFCLPLPPPPLVVDDGAAAAPVMLGGEGT